ncbi:hypothetical protein PMAYCL1PPCAC_09820 [Pristionchus mayeri]|uniref:Cyclin-like domain-containing protein n=1 Tax=Pristionchus mayeri TaxID=1317129 RepID=A0AAN4ZL42_9BILA|nr:hypothetical protein PMAYCL1PPCAC_09820 [Pristionchus mayeri]
MRRASLAPESLLYAQSSAAAAAPAASIAARYRCEEASLPVGLLLAAAATSYPTSVAPHHQLHHPLHTTSFKPSTTSFSSFSGGAASSMAYGNRRRSLPVRGHPRAHSMIVGGQMPAHRRRPVVAPETRLNAAQHPHVSPIYDHKIQMDDRTLRNLKETERELIHTGPTFLKSTQSELQAVHRETVVQWMRDVLCEEASEEEVFPLAVLILDNYLSCQNILLRDVQGIAAACMLMASKMKAPTPINAARLSFFTENSVSSIQIVNFELVILRILKWQIALPTAFDFVDQVFCRVSALRDLKSHFARALYDMQLNVKDAVCRPSMQAAVSLARAARAISAPPPLMDQLRAALSSYLDIDLEMALQMGSASAAAAGASVSATPSSASDEEEEDAAFAASSLAYTPVREETALLQPAAAVVAAPAARAKSPPSTPPSGTDSGFSSAQGTPELGESEKPLASPF